MAPKRSSRDRSVERPTRSSKRLRSSEEPDDSPLKSLSPVRRPRRKNTPGQSDTARQLEPVTEQQEPSDQVVIVLDSDDENAPSQAVSRPTPQAANFPADLYLPPFIEPTPREVISLDSSDDEAGPSQPTPRVSSQVAPREPNPESQAHNVEANRQQDYVPPEQIVKVEVVEGHQENVSGSDASQLTLADQTHEAEAGQDAQQNESGSETASRSVQDNQSDNEAFVGGQEYTQPNDVSGHLQQEYESDLDESMDTSESVSENDENDVQNEEANIEDVEDVEETVEETIEEDVEGDDVEEEDVETEDVEENDEDVDQTGHQDETSTESDQNQEQSDMDSLFEDTNDNIRAETSFDSAQNIESSVEHSNIVQEDQDDFTQRTLGEDQDIQSHIEAQVHATRQNAPATRMPEEEQAQISSAQNAPEGEFPESAMHSRITNAESATTSDMQSRLNDGAPPRTSTAEDVEMHNGSDQSETDTVTDYHRDHTLTNTSENDLLNTAVADSDENLLESKIISDFLRYVVAEGSGFEPMSGVDPRLPYPHSKVIHDLFLNPDTSDPKPRDPSPYFSFAKEYYQWRDAALAEKSESVLIEHKLKLAWSTRFFTEAQRADVLASQAILLGNLRHDLNQQRRKNELLREKIRKHEQKAETEGESQEAEEPLEEAHGVKRKADATNESDGEMRPSQQAKTSHGSGTLQELQPDEATDPLTVDTPMSDAVVEEQYDPCKVTMSGALPPPSVEDRQTNSEDVATSINENAEANTQETSSHFSPPHQETVQPHPTTPTFMGRIENFFGSLRRKFTFSAEPRPVTLPSIAPTEVAKPRSEPRRPKHRRSKELELLGLRQPPPPATIEEQRAYAGTTHDSSGQFDTHQQHAEEVFDDIEEEFGPDASRLPESPSDGALHRRNASANRFQSPGSPFPSVIGSRISRTQRWRMMAYTERRARTFRMQRDKMDQDDSTRDREIAEQNQLDKESDAVAEYHRHLNYLRATKPTDEDVQRLELQDKMVQAGFKRVRVDSLEMMPVRASNSYSLHDEAVDENPDAMIWVLEEEEEEFKKRVDEGTAEPSLKKVRFAPRYTLHEFPVLSPESNQSEDSFIGTAQQGRAPGNLNTSPTRTPAPLRYNSGHGDSNRKEPATDSRVRTTAPLTPPSRSALRAGRSAATNIFSQAYRMQNAYERAIEEDNEYDESEETNDAGKSSHEGKQRLLDVGQKERFWTGDKTPKSPSGFSVPDESDTSASDLSSLASGSPSTASPFASPPNRDQPERPIIGSKVHPTPDAKGKAKATSPGTPQTATPVVGQTAGGKKSNFFEKLDMARAAAEKYKPKRPSSLGKEDKTNIFPCGLDGGDDETGGVVAEKSDEASNADDEEEYEPEDIPGLSGGDGAEDAASPEEAVDEREGCLFGWPAEFQKSKEAGEMTPAILEEYGGDLDGMDVDCWDDVVKLNLL